MTRLTSQPRRMLMVFVDGVGLAAQGPNNPWSEIPTPALRQILGGPLTAEKVQRRRHLCLVPLDATLGVEGLPQSATGQTALFTGVNGAQALGRHVTAFPGPRLRAILDEHSVFLRASRAGFASTFANAFSSAYFEQIRRRELRYSATVCATLAAGLRLRRVDDLARGEAVSWDVVRDRFSARTTEAVSPVTAEQAGRDLANLASHHRLTVYETFLTDLAGHGRLPMAEAVHRIDGLLGGAVEGLDPQTTLVLTSDHGNSEEADHRRHTRNPVPLLAVGPAAEDFAQLSSILEVTPRILASLEGT